MVGEKSEILLLFSSGTQIDDLSGTWYFTYEYINYNWKIDIDLEPSEIILYPGENARIAITVANQGNMPVDSAIVEPGSPLSAA